MLVATDVVVLEIESVGAFGGDAEVLGVDDFEIAGVEGVADSGGEVSGFCSEMAPKRTDPAFFESRVRWHPLFRLF